MDKNDIAELLASPEDEKLILWQKNVKNNSIQQIPIYYQLEG